MSTAAPTLVAIIGPPAVGKMTVGQELGALTSFPLLHNHMLIDLVTEFFPFGTEAFYRLVDRIRMPLHEEIAQTGGGLITTFGWDFDLPSDRELVDRCTAPFLSAGGRVVYIELFAPLEERLRRNKTENRRRSKKTDWATDENIVNFGRSHRLNSDGDFPYPESHLLLDATSGTAAALATRIQEHFRLPRNMTGGQ